MPPIPAIVMLSNNGNGYWPATVVAAVPLGHGSMYAVTAIEPTSSPDAPAFFTATAGQSIHGFWIADDVTGRESTLAGALASMTRLAGLAAS